MLVMDMPDRLPQYAPLMIVQAGPAKKGAAKTDRTLGVCQLIENRRLPDGKPRVSAINSVSPIGWVENYFSTRERRRIEGPSTVIVLENPKHGELKDEGTRILTGGTLVDTGKREYSYVPATDYFGRDEAVMLVEAGGMEVRIVFSFHVVKVINQETEKLCPQEDVQKISLSPDLDRLPRGT